MANRAVEVDGATSAVAHKAFMLGGIDVPLGPLGLVLLAAASAGACTAGGSAGEASAPVPDATAPFDAGRRAEQEAGVPRGSLLDILGLPPPDAELEACAALASDPRWPAPETIEAAVDRINALPRPVAVSCFVASLPRPLRVVATDSTFSAQPATGRASPRVFLMGENLIMSVVPEGSGSHLLEFGQFVSATHTIKGEVELPVTASLEAGAPYRRVPNNCIFCHRDEQPHPSIANALVSEAFRPQPESLVPLAELIQLGKGCDPARQPERCEMLQALFGFGAVIEGAFPSDVSLFLR